MNVCIGGENIAHIVQSNKPIDGILFFYSGFNFFMILARLFLVILPKDIFALLSYLSFYPSLIL
jgi:hypothetical protein